MANLKTNIIIDAKTKLKGAFTRSQQYFRDLKNSANKTGGEVGTTEKAFSRLRNTLLGFVGISIFQGLASRLIEVSDSMTLMKGRLDVVTNSVKESTQASIRLVQIAKETGTSLSANTILFTRLNRPVKALGKSAKFTGDLVSFMAKGLRISGATAGEAASTIRQFSQAMSSGVLRGDEYNSILENSGRVAIALAEGLNVTQGELRKMAEAGKLTSTVVIEALESQFDAIDREFTKIPKTIATSTENVKTSFAEMVGASEGMKGASDSLIKGLEFVAGNLNTIVEVGITMAKVIGVTVLGSMAALGTEKLKQLGVTQQLSNAETAYAAQLSKSKLKATEFKTALATVNSQIQQNVTGIKSHIQNLGQNINVERLAAKIAQRRAQSELEVATALTKSDATLRKHVELIRAEELAVKKSISSKKELSISESNLAVAKEKVAVAQARVNQLAKQSALAVNPAILKANKKDLIRLEKELAIALKQVETNQKGVISSQTALDASNKKVTASTAANVTTMKAANVASANLASSTRVLGSVSAKAGAGMSTFRKNISTLTGAMASSISVAKGAALAMGSFVKSIGIGFAVFEAISVIGELTTSFFKLRDAERKIEKADKDLQRQLESNLDTMQKQAIQAGVNIKGIENNYKALKEATEIQVKHNAKIAEAEKFERDYALASRDTNAELKKLAITHPELAKAITDTNRQIELQSIGFEKIKRSSNETLLEFAKWRKEAPDSLNVLGDKLNSLSDNDFKKFKRSIVDALDAGVGKTKELKNELESINLSEVERAFRKMGLIATSELKRMAVDTENTYNTIKASGNATAEQLKEAYGKVVQAQIDANGGVVSASIKAEAALKGVIIQAGKVVDKVDKAGSSFNKAGSSAQQFGNTAVQATTPIISSVKQLEANLEGARDAYKALKSSGKATMDELRAATNAVNDAQLQLIKSITASIVALKKQAREHASGVREGVHTSNADLVNSRRQNRADDINKRNNANVEATDANGRRPDKTINRKLEPGVQADFDALDEAGQARVNAALRRDTLRGSGSRLAEFQTVEDRNRVRELAIKQETEKREQREREAISSQEAFDARVAKRSKASADKQNAIDDNQAKERSDRLDRERLFLENKEKESADRLARINESREKTALLNEENSARHNAKIEELDLIRNNKAIASADKAIAFADKAIALDNELDAKIAADAEIRRQKREAVIARNRERAADIDANFLKELDSSLSKRFADTNRIIQNIKRGQ